jgi:SAM-dependent methyltransferase
VKADRPLTTCGTIPTGPSQQTIRLAFSCVVDRNDAIERAVLIWAHSLIALEGVDPATVFVHTVAPDLDVLGPLQTLGVQIVHIDRFGDGRHCNKLAQPLSPAEFDADVVILNDCDIAFTGRFAQAIRREAAIAIRRNPRTVLGKTVDFCNPPLDRMARLMAAFDLGPPDPLAHDTLSADPMPRGYFNGGMYAIPAPLLSEFGHAWQGWATRLLGSDKALGILGQYAWHIDQISFYFASRELDMAVHGLDERYNFPTHAGHPSARQAAIEAPYAIHFHNNLGADGLLGPSGVRAVDVEAARINTCLAGRGLCLGQSYTPPKPFENWYSVERDFSMTTKNAASLVTVLKATGIERAETVLDVRCGSGRHLDGLELRGYRGFDQRAAEAGLAQRRGIDGMVTQGTPTAQDRADMVLCLDFAGFAGEVGGPEAAAALLCDMAEDRLLVLAEPGNGPGWLARGASADLARLLAQSGRFAEIVTLGSFAGRTVLLALVARDGKSTVPVTLSGVERLYACLAGPKDGPATVPNAAGEIDILTRLPDHLDGERIAVVAGEDAHDAFDTMLDLRGAMRVGLAPPPHDADDDDDAATPQAAWHLPDAPFDVVAVLPDVDARIMDATFIQCLAQGVRPGGLVFLAVQTEKRALAASLPGRGAGLSADGIRALLEQHQLFPLATRSVALPFEFDSDVMVIEAVRIDPPPVVTVEVPVEVPAEPARPPSRTPEALRRFERKLRRRIKGKPLPE